MKLQHVWMSALLLAVPACLRSERGTASILPTQSGPPLSGAAELKETADGLLVNITVSQAPPGRHGLHVHEQGQCGDGGKAAGDHYNPNRVKHGYLPEEGFTGAHAGDLGNIEVGLDGTGTLELTVPGLSLRSGPHPVIGRAIILHAREDDFGQPTGNAGGRIGCGVITMSKNVK